MPKISPIRRARDAARDIQRTLHRMAKSDERPMQEIADASGCNLSTLQRWGRLDGHAAHFTTIIAVADQVGYELVLRKKIPTGAPNGQQAHPH